MFSSNSYTKGTEVGMLTPIISSSEILSMCLTKDLREFPWATTTTFLPYFIAGTIWSYQKGIVLATVSFNDSVNGKHWGGRSLYLTSKWGHLGSSFSKTGGGME